MDSINIQKAIDTGLNKSVLVLIPKWIRPNHFTYLRLLLTPFLYYLLVLGYLKSAMIVFLIAASTDFIDGSLARTRNQQTELGTVLDPIADKLLIAAVLVFIGLEYLVIKIILGFIAIEILGIALSIFFRRKLGKPIPANAFGKIKMITQSISIGLFLTSIIIKSSSLTAISEYFLFVALFFAAISAIVQTYTHLKKAPMIEEL